MSATRSVRPAFLFGLPASTIALLLMFLATMDAVGTILWLRGPLGRELNPVADRLLDLGEAPFLLIKLLGTAFCALWIERRAEHRYSRLAALAGFAIYGPIVALHILNNAWLLGRG